MCECTQWRELYPPHLCRGGLPGMYHADFLIKRSENWKEILQVEVVAGSRLLGWSLEKRREKCPLATFMVAVRVLFGGL